MRTFLRILVVAAALCAALLSPGAARSDDGIDPGFTASLTEDMVWGAGFPALAGVAVTVLDAPGGAVLETVGAETDATGWFELGEDALATDLVPGMQVVVACGGYEKELTLAALTFDLLDPGRGFGSGTAPAGAQVIVDTWPNGVEQSELVVTAKPDGAWLADFAASGLVVGGNAGAQILDGDGDTTLANRQAPSVHAVYHYEFHRLDVGLGGDNFTPGGTVELELLAAPGGAVLWTGSVAAWNDGDPSGNAGGFDYCCTREMLGLDFDLAPGMQLRATDTVTAVTKELTLAPFGVGRVDPAGDTASGTAPPGANVWVLGSNPPFEGDEYRAETVAGPDGAWQVEFDPAEFDVTWQTMIEAGTGDVDNDWTGAYAQPPTIAVHAQSDAVEGMYFSLGADVLVEVLAAPGGPVLWTATASTGDSRALSLVAGVDLVPGMEVRVTDVPTGVVKSVTLVPLTIDVLDPVTDRASGTAAPGTSARIWIWWAGIGGGEAGDVLADASGAWSFQFDADVTASSSAGLYVADAELDTTNAEIAAPTEGIPALAALVTDLVPDAKLAKPLLEKLDAALASLGRENVAAAVGRLGAFVNQVDALVRSHRLAADAGAELIAAATRIATGLGG